MQSVDRLDYAVCVEVVNKLEAIETHHLEDSHLAMRVAKLMHNHQIMDMGELNELVESLLASAQVSDTGRTAIDIHPDMLLNMEVLSLELSPWAERLRSRIFGSKQAPYHSYDSAVRWIKKFDAAKDRVRIGKDVYEYKAKHNLRFYDTRGEEDSIFVKVASPLEKIILASKRLSRKLEIGLDWNSLVFYVLADTPPFIPPIESSVSSWYVTLPSGRTALHHMGTITIRSGFNYSWLKRAYEGIRSNMGTSKSKSFNTRHFELFRLVTRKGGPPKGKGVVAFWNLIKDIWNEKHKENQYTTWKGVKRAYDLIQGKLDAPYQTKEVKEDETS